MTPWRRIAESAADSDRCPKRQGAAAPACQPLDRVEQAVARIRCDTGAREQEGGGEQHLQGMTDSTGARSGGHGDHRGPLRQAGSRPELWRGALGDA
jgi:hypothetical protein